MSPENLQDLVHVNHNPIQRPGADRLVRTTRIAGPQHARDAVLVLSVEQLAKMLEIARGSVLRRVELPRPGVEIDLYEDSSGHRREVWRFVSGQPRPEPLPMVLPGTGS